MAQSRSDNVTHRFVGTDGYGVEMDMGVKYRIVDTIFRPYNASRPNFTSEQNVQGTFIHTVVPVGAVIEEEPV